MVEPLKVLTYRHDQEERFEKRI